LARIGSAQARAVLEAALEMSPAEAARHSPELPGRAADALATMPAPDHLAILGRLLAHTSPRVRGAAILACLREADPRCRAMLERDRLAKWAVPWWDAEHGK
jgi:hypothetical protein